MTACRADIAKTRVKGELPRNDYQRRNVTEGAFNKAKQCAVAKQT